MIEIKGLYNTAVCYTPELEPAAESQIRAVCDQAAFSACKIRIMPDVHAGMGCTIGTTMTITDKIVPGMVGVDIGCGMETVRIVEKEVDFDALDRLIRREIPGGQNIRSKAHELNDRIDLRQHFRQGVHLELADVDPAEHLVGDVVGFHGVEIPEGHLGDAEPAQILGDGGADGPAADANARFHEASHS